MCYNTHATTGLLLFVGALIVFKKSEYTQSLFFHFDLSAAEV